MMDRCDWCLRERACEPAKAGRGVLWICGDCVKHVLDPADRRDEGGSVRLVHPLIQTARGALVDEDYVECERLLSLAVDAAKDLEASAESGCQQTLRQAAPVREETPEPPGQPGAVAGGGPSRLLA